MVAPLWCGKVKLLLQKDPEVGAAAVRACRGTGDPFQVENLLKRACDECDQSAIDNYGAMLEAVKAYGYHLMYGSPRLRADAVIMFEAVKTWGPALQFAPEGSEVRANKEIVLRAVEQDPLARMFASPELQHDQEVLRKAELCLQQLLQKDNIPDHHRKGWQEEIKVVKKFLSMDWQV